jgi:hypothetical protein
MRACGVHSSVIPEILRRAMVFLNQCSIVHTFQVHVEAPQPVHMAKHLSGFTAKGNPVNRYVTQCE